jgi:hypothetical protein
LRKRGVALTAAGTGGAGLGLGFILAKLSAIDLKQILLEFGHGLGGFLREQGPYALYAVSFSLVTLVLCVWAIKVLIKGKQDEIDRLCKERDNFQKLIVTDWKSTQRGKK